MIVLSDEDVEAIERIIMRAYLEGMKLGVKNKDSVIRYSLDMLRYSAFWNTKDLRDELKTQIFKT